MGRFTSRRIFIYTMDARALKEQKSLQSYMARTFGIT
jgi:hypothetical protein